MTKRNDALEKALSGINLNDRKKIWLWFFLRKTIKNCKLGDIQSIGMRERMTEAINNNEGLAEEINEKISHFLIPEKDLYWITDNKRQHQFVMNEIAQKYGNITFAIEGLNFKEMTIARIDTLNIDQRVKLSMVNNLRIEWEKKSQSDPLFEWFKSANETSKLNAGWEIAKKRHPTYCFSVDPFKDIDEMLSFFDATWFSYPDKELFVLSVKKRWNQQEYRKKTKDKKQCNFILTKDTINKLEQLAKRHHLRKAEVIEHLVREQFK